MQTFYEGWRIVLAFLRADAQVPQQVVLPRPAEREVARMLAERREFPVREVVEALQQFAQPNLLATEDRQTQTLVVQHRTFWSRLFSRNVDQASKNAPAVFSSQDGAMVAPIPRYVM